MAQQPDRKLYLGPRLRVLRRELGISQTQMADELGVSPSYLNHLERNQRPLTAQMLLRLANTYDIDMRDFVSGSTSADAHAALGEALADPLVRDIGVARNELLEVAENYPGVAEAITRLHAALVDLRQGPDLVDQLAGAKTVNSSLEWLGGLIAQRRNHFATLETAAEALGEALPDDPAARAEGMRVMLFERFGTKVAVVPQKVLGDALRHYDFHRRRLMLSERLTAPGRAFGLAYQLALAGIGEPIEEMVARADPPDAAGRALYKVALANYAAAALLMPYAPFLAVAEESRYDLATLQGRFGVSPEQAFHRLTTLDRSGARGVPFFLLRVDRAGNVSKRIAGGEGGLIVRTGGNCPRWLLHEARPGEVRGQYVEMTDGATSFTLVTALADPNRAGGPVLLALGCDARHAGRIALSDGLDAQRPMKIGPGCRLCERHDCPDRALPPIARTMEISSIRRAANPFPFRST